MRFEENLASAPATGTLLSLFFIFIAFAAETACSASPGTSTFGADPDAGPEASAPLDGGTFQGNDGAGDARTTCAPTLPAGFAPKWQPPASDLSACKAADRAGYAAACLAQPYVAATCDAFKTANAKCAGCLESDATAAQLGPVLWHDARTYFTLNIAGCIAVEAKDTTGAGCAGAYQSVVTCKEQACDACFAIQSPSFTTFAACEKAAGSGVCATYGAAEGTKCVGVKDAGAATSACFPSATDGAIDLFNKIAPLFCGG